MIAEQLANKRIAITGSTGFVGTALVERLLRCVPDCTLVLLIRPSKRHDPTERARREIFKNNAFDRLKAELKDAALHPPRADGTVETFDEMVARRVVAIGGDVSTDGLGLNDADRAVFASCDTIIHSAAAVSFDSPLDSAVEINLMGPVRIAETCHALGITPHMVGVSTCYVAGNRRGNAPEALVSEGHWDIGLNWRKEVAASRRLRGDIEAKSRTTEQLVHFRSEARKELGAAGGPALAGKTESLREAWVKAQLVEAGRSRAASVGWPDAYAYTKALGEQALTETKGNVPVSIVRPSIIESALAEPFPGWIRGFRMAEPVILSYARGLLKEFPGVPEGTVDVIPVDIVVAAIITVAAVGPERAAPITQVASGGINPLKYKLLVDNVRAWFTEHPLYDNEGQPIVVPEWQFPARGRVKEQLERAQSIIGKTERVLQALPLRGKQAAWAANWKRRRTRSTARTSTCSCTACTPSARPSTRSTDSSRCGTRWPLPTRPSSTSTRAAWTGPRTSAPSTCRPSCTTRVPRSPPARARSTAPPACASPCSPPTATWRRSTWRTRSSPATSWRASPGWPPAG
jgi:fatty acyl-CoA reductase